MDSNKIYEDIATRTNGDIYIGVVGPVRTGKSTFIKQFMEKLIIPRIENVYQRERARDELPQSGSGRSIMTAEPKFVPEEAVEISFGDNSSLKIRMVDCVGYMVPGAIGQFEDGMPRMVMTPWSDNEMPMRDAAEMGTRKVIDEHSTIGLVVTTDGSVIDIPREDYLEAEARVISELRERGKPFLVVLNCADPSSQQAIEVKRQIEEEHGVSCVALNCMDMSEDDMEEILKEVLYEFPMREMGIILPEWVKGLPDDDELKKSVFSEVKRIAKGCQKVKEGIAAAEEMERDIPCVCRAYTENVNLGEGIVSISMDVPRELFFRIVKEKCGFDISDDSDLMPLLEKMAKMQKAYDRIKYALMQVENTGYGIVMPAIEELSLAEPEIMRQGGRFGVKLRASAPSIHMIRADIETEVSPIVGSEKQSEELVKYLLDEFDDDPLKIWESNIFGKSLHELVNEGLNAKLNKMPEDARMKLRQTLERIINEGSGGLICIIL